MIYNILEYGAVGDGKTDCAAAIQKAIDRCSVEGGRVVIPAGRFLSGFLQLKSNVELYLEQGAALVSDLSDEEEKYFLFACHGENITISGNGTIDGQGRLRFVDDNADYGAHECPLFVSGNRPRTSYFEDIENLTVRDVTFYDAAFWTLHMAGCRNVMVDGIRILNNDRGPNNDGIDPDSCKNVVIRNCIIESGDDAIVVKSTKAMSEKYGSCENVVIQGCILHSRDSALKIGTESFGDIRNILFCDCIVRDCSRAVGIWSRDGGVISDIQIHHVMGNTRCYADCPEREFAPRWWGKGEPFFISATKRKGAEEVPGAIRDISVDHVRLTAESCLFMGGESYAPIECVRMKDIVIQWKCQSRHMPGLFDEQPSERDVYAHEIPCIYGRDARDVRIQGEFSVDESLKQVIREREILDHCTDFVVEGFR